MNLIDPISSFTLGNLDIPCQPSGGGAACRRRRPPRADDGNITYPLNTYPRGPFLRTSHREGTQFHHLAFAAAGVSSNGMEHARSTSATSAPWGVRWSADTD